MDREKKFIAEMSEEGNYNQIDGIINNVPAKEIEGKKGLDSIQGNIVSEKSCMKLKILLLRNKK